MAKDGAPQVPLPKNYGDEGVWTFFLCQMKQEKFLHLELQNKAHKLFGTISNWAQSCAAKNSLAFQKVVLVSLSAGWTEGKNTSKQIRQL